MARAVLLAATTLAACAPAARESEPMNGPDSDACGAASLQHLVGRPVAELPDADALPARFVRILRPGQPATMDFRTDRLNVILDADGRIAELRCG